MRSVIQFIFLFFLVINITYLTSCESETSDVEVKLYDLDGFIPQYNKKIDLWLKEEVELTNKQAEKLRAKMTAFNERQNDLSEEEQKQQRKLQREIDANQRILDKYNFRLSLGEFFSFRDLSSIPKDLVWETGMNEPEIGDPRAKKGGTFNSNIEHLFFPQTLRAFGPDANHPLSGKIYDDISMSLISFHPITENPIPGIANTWALSKDKRTVYYKINPKATYSDGLPILAKDFMTYVYVRVSDNVFAPFTKQYFKEQLANITVYDSRTLSITIPETKPNTYAHTSLAPSSPKFYQEYGPDYTKRYQWRVPPTTGAYDLKPENVKKGRSLTMTRVKDWWAKDLKYYRYRFNVDRMRYILIRDPAKCYELFKVGELDTFLIPLPNYWHQKTEIQPVFDGYIEKKKFYTHYPFIPYGMYLNVEEGVLKDKNVRKGIHHAMNFQKVNDQMYYGDYIRINQFSDGYADYTDPKIKARKYDPVKAREYFKKAGFTIEGEDRILRNKTGDRLSFSCTVPTIPERVQILTVLQKEALDCGVELLIDVAEVSVAFSKARKKQHQAFYGGWLVSASEPNYRSFFHSETAFDNTGARNLNSNNLNLFANERMDVVSDVVRNAKTKEELKEAAYEAQQILHDEAIFIPSVFRSYTAIAHWRWVKWPDTEHVKFSYPLVYDVLDSNLFWIDEDLKKETLEARRNGEVFPEVEQVIDDYRRDN